MPQWNICGAVVAKLNELANKKKKDNSEEIEMNGRNTT